MNITKRYKAYSFDNIKAGDTILLFNKVERTRYILYVFKRTDTLCTSRNVTCNCQIEVPYIFCYDISDLNSDYPMFLIIKTCENIVRRIEMI